MDAKGDRAWQPANRQREVSKALQAYALMATSAATGAVRDLSLVRRVDRCPTDGQLAPWTIFRYAQQARARPVHKAGF